MKMTLKAVLLAGVFGGIASAAFAADLMAEPPMAPTPVTSDSHIYAGVNIGYGEGVADHQPVNPVGPGGDGFDLNLAGFLVGGQVGAMFHLSDMLVGGVQADIDWSNITGSNDFGAPVDTITETINWIATAEGRLGFDAGGFTPYLSGGLAAAQGTRTSSGGGASDTQIHPGLSVGAGVMVQVADNVSLDLEARYQVFQAETYDSTGGTPPSVALNVSSVRAGINFGF